MRLPDNAPATCDRVSTREELFEVLEVLGGFEERQGPETGALRDLLTALEADPAIQLLEETGSGDEQLLMEMEPFNSLLTRKAEPIN